MSYHLKSSRRPNRTRRLVWTLFIVLFLSLVIFPSFLFGVSSVSLKGSMSIKNRISTGFDIFTSYFTERNKLVYENEQLLLIADQIEGYKLQNETLFDENKKLKGIRNSIQSTDIIAQVIATPPRTPFDMIIIEGAENISVGDQVTSVSGGLVGEIIESSGKNAKVKLLSSDENIFMVENARTGEKYEITGRNSGNYFSKLPKETDINIDDVLIARVGEYIAPVGVIKEIEIRDSSPFITAFIISPVSILSLQHVVVKDMYIENQEE